MDQIGSLQQTNLESYHIVGGLSTFKKFQHILFESSFNLDQTNSDIISNLTVFKTEL